MVLLIISGFLSGQGVFSASFAGDFDPVVPPNDRDFRS
jgi:hypothetical protein